MQVLPATRRAFSAVRIIPAAVGLLMALVLLPLMTLGYLGANDNTGRLLTANRDAMLDNLEQQLRGALDGTAGQVAIIAGMIADRRIDPDDREAFSRYMAGAAQGQSSMVSIGWMESAGGLRRWVRGSPAEEAYERGAIRDVEGVWRRAALLRQPHWNDPVVSRLLGEAIIPHVHPVMRDGALYGVLITVLTSQSVARHFDRMEEGITPFVLVGRDNVLVHRNIRIDRSQALLAEDRLPRLDEVDDPALAIIWNNIRRPAQDVPGRSQVHWSWLGDRYDAQVYSYRTVAGYGTEPWIIGFHRSSLATFRERWVIQALFWGSALLFVLSVGLAILLGRRAVAPAGEIATAARALERLDFDGVERPKIQESRVAEVRDISQALSRAAVALKRFQTYVPRTLVSQLMTVDAGASEASDREVSVMFLDLANYTAFSDGRSAREVASYLNGVFAEVGPLIEAAGGTIDKYTGDGLMAVWGAPVADADHARAALGAGLRILERMTPIVASSIANNRAACRIRLGLHTGRVLAGDLGFDGRIDYTVVGRTVNIAQRCQAALKGRMGDAPVALAITESMREALDLPLEGLSPLPPTPNGERSYRLLWLTPAAGAVAGRKRSTA